MSDAEILLLILGVLTASVVTLRIAFCRIVRNTRRLREDHGWDRW